MSDVDGGEVTTVTVEGPCRFMVDVTEEELERLKESDSPFSDMPREPKEWGPVPGDWSVNGDPQPRGESDD